MVTAYTLKKPEDGENISVHSDSDISMVTEVTEIDKNSRGIIYIFLLLVKISYNFIFMDGMAIDLHQIDI